MNKIYIRKGNNLNTLEDYINDIFINRGYSTIRVKETYSDPNFNYIECHEARRSFEDILNILQTNYDQNITERDLAIEILRLNKESNLKSILCSDISKIVFYKSTDVWEYKQNYKLCYGSEINSAGLDYCGNGKYSLREILDLAGFKDNYLND